MRDSFVKTLMKLAEIDKSIMLITGDLGFGVLKEFSEKYPKQFLNVGVAEQNMIGVACGMALNGHKVYAYSIANFTILRPLEQIRNDICYHDCNVTLVSVGAGFSYGQLGMSHFATEDLAIMRALPNMRVIAPCTPWEAEQMTEQMYNIDGPKYLRLDKGNAGIEPRQSLLGVPLIVKEGTDVTLVSIGAILSEAIKASEALESLGISCEIISVNSLKPLDFDPIVQSVIKTNGILTIEEHNRIGGLYGAISEHIMMMKLPLKYVGAIALDDLYPSVVGDQDYLRAQYDLDAEAIKDNILQGLGKTCQG